MKNLSSYIHSWYVRHWHLKVPLILKKTVWIHFLLYFQLLLSQTFEMLVVWDELWLRDIEIWLNSQTCRECLWVKCEQLETRIRLFPPESLPLGYECYACTSDYDHHRDFIFGGIINKLAEYSVCSWLSDEWIRLEQGQTGLLAHSYCPLVQNAIYQHVGTMETTLLEQSLSNLRIVCMATRSQPGFILGLIRTLTLLSMFMTTRSWQR